MLRSGATMCSLSNLHLPELPGNLGLHLQLPRIIAGLHLQLPRIIAGLHKNLQSDNRNRNRNRQEVVASRLLLPPCGQLLCRLLEDQAPSVCGRAPSGQDDNHTSAMSMFVLNPAANIHGQCC